MAKESRLEKFLQREVRSRGGMTLKMTSPSVRGVPDQVVIMACTGIFFVELKSPDGRLHPLQCVMHTKIVKHGGAVYVVSSRAAIIELLDTLGA